MAESNKAVKVVLTPEQKLDVKHTNFLKVCTPRMQKAIKAIRLVANCASNNYFSTDEEKRLIFEAFTKAVDFVGRAFDKSEKKVDNFGFGS